MRHINSIFHSIKANKLLLWVCICSTIAIIIFLFFYKSANKRPYSISVLRNKASKIDNVIIIICDALRADHLGVYGYNLNTSPNIDRLAKNGVLCQRAICQASHTKPSIASLFTSTYPSIHNSNILWTKRKIKKGKKYELQVEADTLPGEFLTMAELFSANGYFTMGIHQNSYISSRYNFNQGFKVYKNERTNIQIDETINFFRRGCIASDLNLANNINKLLNTKSSINLIENGSFEQDGFWKGTFQVDNKCIFHEKNSLYISKKFIPFTDYYHLKSQKIRVIRGKRYLFGAFVKTHTLKDSTRVTIAEKDPRINYYYTASSNSISGDNNWTLLWGTFLAKTDNVILHPCRINNFINGEIWVDNCFLIPYDQLPDKFFFHPSKSFIYLHNINVHGPFTADSPRRFHLSYFTNKIKEKRNIYESMAWYDAEIRHLDMVLGLLFEKLRELKILEKTLIILTADHGEAFEEHGLKGHGYSHRYDETIRVPLIFYNPILFPKPQIISDAVQLIDVLPTLIDLFQLKIPEEYQNYPFQGISIFSNKISKDKRIAFNYRLEELAVATNYKWKYIHGPAHEGKISLYNIIKDPEEKLNLVNSMPQIAELFEKKILEQKIKDEKIAKLIKPTYMRKTVSEYHKALLKTLGYIK